MLAGGCAWYGGGTRRGSQPVMSAEYGSDDWRCVTGGAAAGVLGVALGGAVGAGPNDAPGVEAAGVVGVVTGAVGGWAPGTGRISGPDCGPVFDESDSGKTAGGVAP